MRFQNLISYISEAFKLKDISKYRLGSKGQAYHDQKINDVFKGKDRIVLDFDIDLVEAMENEPALAKTFFKVRKELLNSPDIMERFKTSIDITEKEYLEGYAIVGKQKVRIGKLLEIIKDPDLIKKYKIDSVRKMYQKKYKVVISRHPYDIAGASTDKEWTSCMTMGTYCPVYKRFTTNDAPGSNRRYIFNDIQYGTLVAYLIDNADRHPNGKIAVRKPFSRIFIKPFDGNETDDVVYGVGKIYGVKMAKFQTFIEEWTEKNLNNKKLKDIKYFLRLGLYNDEEKIATSQNHILIEQKNKVLEQWVREKMEEINGEPEINKSHYEIEQNGHITTISLVVKLSKELRKILPKGQSMKALGEDLKIIKIIKKYFTQIPVWFYYDTFWYNPTNGFLTIPVNLSILRSEDYMDSEAPDDDDDPTYGNYIEELTRPSSLNQRMSDTNMDDMLEDYFDLKQFEEFIRENIIPEKFQFTEKHKKEIQQKIEEWSKEFKNASKKYLTHQKELNDYFHRIMGGTEKNFVLNNKLIQNFTIEATTLELHLKALWTYFSNEFSFEGGEANEISKIRVVYNTILNNLNLNSILFTDRFENFAQPRYLDQGFFTDFNSRQELKQNFYDAEQLTGENSITLDKIYNYHKDVMLILKMVKGKLQRFKEAIGLFDMANES